MSQIKPAEVSAILREQLAGNQTAADLQEVGTVLQVGDGIARIYGLSNVQAGELIEFENGVRGIALNLEEDNVGAVLLEPAGELKEGSSVKRLNRIASVKVGRGMLGRVVNTLGEPIDGKGHIEGDLYEMPIERKAPGVIYRQPVAEPLQTGIKAIDAMIPIGRGQRELIMVTVKQAKPRWRSTRSSTKKNFTTAASPCSVSMSRLAKKALRLRASCKH